jgi:hypothetical protein
VRLVQTGPGTYEGEFDAPDPGNYVAVLNYHGPQNQGGVMLSGMAVNSSPELRDLKSNESVLHEVARKTGGRVLTPFDAANANLFNRDGLQKTASPLPIWDILIPILLAMIIVDVATRRIAWDWIATKRMAFAAVDFVRSFTTTRKVETRDTLDALKRVREETAENTKQQVSATDEPLPDRSAKFEASGVEGDITQVVGGATDKPVPGPKQKDEKKDSAQPGDHTSGLLAAKRRAQQQIREKEEGKE